MLQCWFLIISFLNVFTQNTVEAPFTEAGVLVTNLQRISLDCHIFLREVLNSEENLAGHAFLLLCSHVMKILGLVCAASGIYFLKDAVSSKTLSVWEALFLGILFLFSFLLNANAHVKGLIFNMVINLLFTKSGRLVGKLYFSTHVGR